MTRIQPQLGETFTWQNLTLAERDRVTNLSGLSHLSRKSDQIKIRDYMDRPSSLSGYLAKLGSPTSSQ